MLCSSRWDFVGTFRVIYSTICNSIVLSIGPDARYIFPYFLPFLITLSNHATQIVSLCSFMLCSYRWDLSSNYFPHISQVNSTMSVYVMFFWIRFSFNLFFTPRSGHLYYCLIVGLLFQTVSHTPHRYSHCVHFMLCSYRWDSASNYLPHTAQVNTQCVCLCYVKIWF